VPCTFWLLEALIRLGRADEGRALFEQLLGLTNEQRLLPEEIDPVSARTSATTRWPSATRGWSTPSSRSRSRRESAMRTDGQTEGWRRLRSA